ncbi:aldo/keto reductase [Streptomyces sp. NPDC051569]|uniref:aldo/keto reductase n=1 Tax=Streptomyces sp. NPDC051569 TaxID=3365661 RepID=UPI0037B33769
MTSVPNVVLSNGVEIPQLGFGVSRIDDGPATDAVLTALEAGYRSIDTATLYGNEAGVGRAVASSGLPRDELFITTKLWNDDQGYDATLRAFDAGLARLGLDHVDLYLIHWPAPARGRYLDTWRALEKLLADGRTRAIGVSNFRPSHLQRVLDEGGAAPVLNQIELHPGFQQAEPRAFHARHGIVTEAWSPLAQGAVLQQEAITEIAARHEKSPAQVVIRWHLQLGNVVIPKSVTPERIRENIAVFDFELSGSDMDAMATLDRGLRLGADPDVHH